MLIILSFFIYIITDNIKENLITITHFHAVQKNKKNSIKLSHKRSARQIVYIFDYRHNDLISYML